MHQNIQYLKCICIQHFLCLSVYVKYTNLTQIKWYRIQEEAVNLLEPLLTIRLKSQNVQGPLVSMGVKDQTHNFPKPLFSTIIKTQRSQREYFTVKVSFSKTLRSTFPMEFGSVGGWMKKANSKNSLENRLMKCECCRNYDEECQQMFILSNF